MRKTWGYTQSFPIMSFDTHYFSVLIGRYKINAKVIISDDTAGIYLTESDHEQKYYPDFMFGNIIADFCEPIQNICGYTIHWNNDNGNTKQVHATIFREEGIGIIYYALSIS